jgi:hypothetical protein
MARRQRSAETTPGFRASPERVAIQWRLVAIAVARSEGASVQKR